MERKTKIIIGLVTLAVVGGVAYYFYNKKHPKDEKKEDSKSNEAKTLEVKEEKSPKDLKIDEPQIKSATSLSQSEADEIAKSIKSTADSEKKAKLKLGYVSPNLTRFMKLKEAGYDYSNGVATKK